jgi:hypothetical protein
MIMFCQEFISWSSTVHYRVDKTPPLEPILGYMIPVHIFISIYDIYFNIILASNEGSIPDEITGFFK